MPKPRAPSDEPITFGPFTLDPAGGQLLRHATVVPLRRKALEVLRYLAAREGQVVSNAELLDAVWPNVHVTPQTLTNVIRELRIALDERARAPRYLHTIHRQGHCVRTSPPAGEAADPSGARAIVVGRDDELRRLEALWREARLGRSRIAFVTGEPGIGKTTLVDAAVRALAHHTPGMWVARGSCIEHHGHDEAYVPMLTALDEIVTGPRGEHALATLRRCAPTWLVQMPWHLDAGDHERLEHALLGTTAGRMLREGLALIRSLATDRPLLLVLEDLHWSDLATLDLLAALGRRPVAAPLLVLGTYRRVDAIVRTHAIVELARDLRRTAAADEVALPPFDAAAVGAYLGARFAPTTFPGGFCARLLEHSVGNPLFLSALADQLVARGAIAAGDGRWRLVGDPATILLELPQSLRDFVMAELGAMDRETREVVEAASVAGVDFAAAEVAAALDRPADAVERTCETLGRIGRVLRIGDDSGGEAARRYAFLHAAHRRIVYDQIAPLRRRALHAATANGLLASPEAGGDGLAARLALHFERAGEPAKASDHFERAARYAERRFAYRESAAYIRSALAHAGSDTPERAAALELRLGALLALVAGFSAPETEEAFHRARALWSAANRPDGLFMAEMALCRLHLARAEIGAARAHSERLLALRESALPGFAVHACCWAGITASSLGDLRRARALLEEGRNAPPAPGLMIHHDVHRILRSQLALVLTAVGELPGAAVVGAEALDGSVAANRAPDLAHALVQAAECAAFRRDERAGVALAARALAVAEESELPSFQALGRFYLAAMDEGRPGRERLAVMREALDARHALGDRWQDSVLLTLVAERELAEGDLDGATRTIAEADAHVVRSEEHHHESELLRLRAEVAVARGGRHAVAEAQPLLQRALDVAARQGALLWELRAACVAARLPLAPAGRSAARRALQGLVGRFPAEDASRDLQAARALLGHA
jgi:DNA-binding winged helix-turn-helix (wHTH) protein